MTIGEQLNQFYTENGIATEGGVEKDWFDVKMGPFTVKLPNAQWRKEVIYLHDIHHLLNNCDTTWRGEAYIAGWETGTGMAKFFPVNTLILMTLALTLLIQPRLVIAGYLQGLKEREPRKTGLSKQQLLNLTKEELKEIISLNPHRQAAFSDWLALAGWALLGSVIGLFPLIVLGIVGIYFL